MCNINRWLSEHKVKGVGKRPGRKGRKKGMKGKVDVE